MTKIYQPTLFDKNEAEMVSFGVALLGLASISGLGQQGLEALVSKFGDNLGHLFRLSDQDVASAFVECKVKGGDKFASIVSNEPDLLIRRGEEELAELKSRKVHVIAPSVLPERLRSINGDAPKWLFAEGKVDTLASRPVIAVVGTRTPSETGLEAARIVATILAAYPVVMVSGLADGIDGQAHYYSLKFGVKNLAFLGHGINHTFPEGTAELRRSIVEKGGAVVSEYLPRQSYQKRQFIARNRLQAALADVVIPIEAAAASGTAHTIRYARRYARRLVGMNWNGANGIVDDLRTNNDRLIDIFTSRGQKELDQIVKDILHSERINTYPFSQLEKRALQELSNRTYTEGDVNRFVEDFIKAALQRKPREPSSNEPA